jgi:hypothetical protein
MNALNPVNQASRVLVFDPEDGSSTLLRNVSKLLSDYPTSQYSLLKILLHRAWNLEIQHQIIPTFEHSVLDATILDLRICEVQTAQNYNYSSELHNTKYCFIRFYALIHRRNVFLSLKLCGRPKEVPCDINWKLQIVNPFSTLNLSRTAFF